MGHLGPCRPPKSSKFTVQQALENLISEVTISFAEFYAPLLSLVFAAGRKISQLDELDGWIDVD